MKLRGFMSWSLIVVFLVAIVVKDAESKKTHAEISSAKKLLDELLLRLSLRIILLREKTQAAIQTQKDSEQQSARIREDLKKVHRVQSLLSQLLGKVVPSLGSPCDAHFDLVDYQGKRPIYIRTRSTLPANYTLSFKVNHRQLIDKNLAQANGNDVRIFYQPHPSKEPIQIDRIISGLGTTNAIISFKLQESLPSNTLHNASYALIFGSKSAGQAMGNPDGVYLFYDDFSDTNLHRKWTKQNFGYWSVKNGRLFGKTGNTPTGDSGEIGIFAKEGETWADYEVELDFMEASAVKSMKMEYPGPFLRIKDAGFKTTTAWWIEYATDSKACTMRPFNNNKDGSWLYRGNLPTPLRRNKWFHFKYRVQGQTISQWADGHVIHDNVAVASAWQISKGTLGFGCHKAYGQGCRSYYDNIRVRVVVPSAPLVSLGDSCSIVHHTKYLLGGQTLPADSCKQIHDATLLDGKPLASNGVYWIKTTRDGKIAVQTYCDIENGGWTLVGKINGRKAVAFACIDARVLAVHHASRVMFSSGDVTSDIGTKWVQWPLPRNRKVSTLWNHAAGCKKVTASTSDLVTVTAWNGVKKKCYQNKYGIMPFRAHGGSYPAATFNKRGNTLTNDRCMGVGVMSKGSSAHGWTQNGNGYDSPQADIDWPNRVYNHQKPRLSVWLK